MKRRILELIPLLLVIGALTHTALKFTEGQIVLISQHIFAFALTGAAIVVYLFNGNAFNFLMASIAILGMLNIIVFTPSVETIGISFGGGSSGDGIQLFSLVLLITLIFLHRTPIINWINKDSR